MSDSITVPSTFKKSWNTTKSFDGVLVHLPGRAFIKYDASIQANAIVDIVSSSQEVLDLVSFNVSKAVGNTIEVGCKQVLALDRPNQAFLNISADAASDAHAAGSLLVHVTLKRPLLWVKSAAESFVSSGVLANGADKRVSITSIGVGNVSAVAYYPISLANLTLATVGAGSVQFTTESLSGGTDVLALAVTGSGSVAIQANDINVHKLHTALTGTGSVYVTAKKSLNAPELATTIVGKGNVSYYPQGTTINNTITISGTGYANTGSIVSQNSTVVVWGSGGAVVQVVDTLSATISGNGKVQYYNATVPAHLPKPKGWWIFSSPSATPTEENFYNTYDFRPQPADKAVDVVIDLNRSTAGRCFVHRYTTGEQVATNSLLLPDATSHVEVYGAFAAMLFALVAFLVVKAKKRPGYSALPK